MKNLIAVLLSLLVLGAYTQESLDELTQISLDADLPDPNMMEFNDHE